MSSIVSYIAPFEGTSADFGIMANVEVSAKEKKAAINQARRHLCVRVIPRMGRSNGGSDRTSAMGRVLGKHIKQDDGHFVNETVVCDCGGHFVADNHGEYVCNVCGIVEDFATIVAPTIIVEDEAEEEEEPEEESIDEEGISTSDHASPYDRSMPSGEAAIERRLAAHQAAWKASKAYRPSDEQAAKDKARAAKDRHDAVMKADRASNQILTYQGKWQKAQRDYRLRRILTAIKEGMTDTVSLRKYMDVSNNAFYADIEQLKTESRVTSVVEGRKQILTLVAKDVPARHVPARKTETSFKEAFVNWHTEKPTSFPWKE